MSPEAVTLMIPVYNGLHAVRDALEEIDAWRARRTAPVRILFVDDGSRDGTFEQLAAWVRTHDEARVVRLAQNRGLHTAMRAGFEHAETDLVVTTEINLEHGLDAVDRMLERMTGSVDAVCARRIGRRDAWWRMAPSRVINAMARACGGLGIRDVHCLLKIWRRDFALSTFEDASHGHFLLSLCGARLVEVDVDFSRRHYGISRFPIHTLARDFTQMLSAVLSRKLGLSWPRNHPTRYEVREIASSEADG